MSEDSFAGVLADCTDVNCTHVSLTGFDQPSSVLCIEDETVLTNNTDLTPSQVIGNKSFLKKLNECTLNESYAVMNELSVETNQDTNSSPDFQNINRSDYSIYQACSDVDNIANSFHAKKIKKRIPPKISVHFSPDYTMDLRTNFDEESGLKEDKSNHVSNKTELFSKNNEKPKNLDITTTDMLTEPKGKDRIIEKDEMQHLTPEMITESFIRNELKRNTYEKDSLEQKSDDGTTANTLFTPSPDNYGYKKKRKLKNTVSRKISVPFSFDTSNLTENGKVHEDNIIGLDSGTLKESNAEINEFRLEIQQDTNSSSDFQNINRSDCCIDQACSDVSNIANSFHTKKMKKRIPPKISVHFSPDYTMDLSTNLDEESRLKEDKSDHVTKNTEIFSKNNEQPKNVNKMSIDMLTKHEGKDTLIETVEMVIPVDTKFMEIEHLTPDTTTKPLIGNELKKNSYEMEHLNPDTITESFIRNELKKNTCEKDSLLLECEDGTTTNMFVTPNHDNSVSKRRKLKNTGSRKISIPVSFDASNLTENGNVHENNQIGLDSSTLEASNAEINEFSLEIQQDTNSSPDFQNINKSDCSIDQACSDVKNIANSLHAQKMKKRIPPKISVNFSPDYTLDLSTNLDEESGLKENKSDHVTKKTKIVSKNNEQSKNVDVATTDMLTEPKCKDRVIEKDEMQHLNPEMITESLIRNELMKNTYEKDSLVLENEGGIATNMFVTPNHDNSVSKRRKLKNTGSRKISVPFSFDASNLTENGKVHENHQIGLDSGTLEESNAEINEFSLEIQQDTNSSPDFQNINKSDCSIDQACSDVNNIANSLHAQKMKKRIPPKISVNFSPDYTLDLSTNLDEESGLKDKSDHVTKKTEIFSKNNEKHKNVDVTTTDMLTEPKCRDRVIEKDEMQHLNPEMTTESLIRNELMKNTYEKDSLVLESEGGTATNMFVTPNHDNSVSKRRKLKNTGSRKISVPFSFDASNLTENGRVHENHQIGLDSGTLKECNAEINGLGLENQQESYTSPDIQNANRSDCTIDQACSDVNNIANSLHTQKIKKTIPARISVHFSPDDTMDLSTNLDEESGQKEDKSDHVTKKTEIFSKNNEQSKNVNKINTDMLTEPKGKDKVIKKDEMEHLNQDTITESFLRNELLKNTYEKDSLVLESEYGTTTNMLVTLNHDNSVLKKRKLNNTGSRKVCVSVSFDTSNLTENRKVHEDNKTAHGFVTLKESNAEINVLSLETKQESYNSPDIQNINSTDCSIDQANNIANSLPAQKVKKTIPARISVDFSPDYTMDLSTSLDEESGLKEDKSDHATKKTEIFLKNNEKHKNVDVATTDMLTEPNGKDRVIKKNEMEHLNPDTITESFIRNELKKNTCEKDSLVLECEDGTTTDMFVTPNHDNSVSKRRKLKNTRSRKISVPVSFDTSNFTENGKVHENNQIDLDSGTLEESNAEINEFSLENQQDINSSSDFQNINRSDCCIDQACSDVYNIANSLPAQKVKKRIPPKISVHFSPDYTMDLRTNFDEESGLKEDKSNHLSNKTELFSKNNEQSKNVNKMSTDMLTKPNVKDRVSEKDEMEHLNPDTTTGPLVGNELKKNSCEKDSLVLECEDGTTTNMFVSPNHDNSVSKRRKLKNTGSQKISVPVSFDTSNLTENGKVHEVNKIAHGSGTLKECNAEINELGLENQQESYTSPDIQNANRSDCTIDQVCSDVNNIANSLHTQKIKKTIPARISVHFNRDYTMDLSTNLDEESGLKEDKSDHVTKKTEIISKNKEQSKNVNKMGTDMFTKHKGKDTLIEKAEMVIPVDTKFMEIEHLIPDTTTEPLIGIELKKNYEKDSLVLESEDGTTENKFVTPNPDNSVSKKRKVKNTGSRKVSVPLEELDLALNRNKVSHANRLKMDQCLKVLDSSKSQKSKNDLDMRMSVGLSIIRKDNEELLDPPLINKICHSTPVVEYQKFKNNNQKNSSGEGINQNHVFVCPDIPSRILRERSVNNKSLQLSNRHRKDDLHHSEGLTKKNRTFYSTTNETDGFIQDVSIIASTNAKAGPQKMFHSTPISKTYGKNKSKLKGCNNTKHTYGEEPIQHDDKMIQVSKTIFGSSTEVTNVTLSKKKSGEFSYFSEQPDEKNKSQIKESIDSVYSVVERSKELESSEEGRSYKSDFVSTLGSENSHFTRSCKKRVTFKDVSAIENSPTDYGSSSSDYSQRKSVKFRNVISLIDDDTVDSNTGLSLASRLSVGTDVSNDKSDLKGESKSKMDRSEVSLDYATEIPEIILTEDEIEENCEESTECSLYTKIKLMSKCQKEDKKIETRKTTLRNHKIVRNRDNVRGSFENDSKYKNSDYEITGKKLKPHEKWVSPNLIKFLNEKLLNDNLDYIVNCERLVSILCSVVNAVKSLKNVNDIEFALLPLKNALVKYKICCNMIEYCTFISRFTPFEFQCKALPLGGFYGSVKRANNKILTDPILTDTEKISSFIDYSHSIQQ